jgi:hypothetical protein
VIPIPKPGQDAADPGNYRPIALTSCLYKTFKRLVNERLVQFLETSGVLTECQSGFWKRAAQQTSFVVGEFHARSLCALQKRCGRLLRPGESLRQDVEARHSPRSAQCQLEGPLAPAHIEVFIRSSV